MGGPLAVVGAYKWYQSRTQTSVESVRAHANMANDLGAHEDDVFLRRCEL